MLRQLLKARGRKDGESVMKERGRCWEENYDEVRETNDKSHSERKTRRWCEKRKGGGLEGQCEAKRIY
jgi:hypothetical protein